MELMTFFRRHVVARLPMTARQQLTARLPGGITQWYGERSIRCHDIFVVSPPKAGRTWVRAMLGKAIQLHFRLPAKDVLEVQDLGSRHRGVPKILFTHDGPMTYDIASLEASKGWYRGKAVVLLARDPRDAVVSTYYYVKVRNRWGKHDFSLVDWLEKSNYFERLIGFYNSWAAHRDVPASFLLLRYEDLHDDPGRELRRLLDFIGLPDVGQSIVEEAVSFASFDNMRKMEEEDSLDRLRPGRKGDFATYKTRRGEVGGFTDELAAADAERLTLVMNDQLSDFYRYPTRRRAQGDHGVGPRP